MYGRPADGKGVQTSPEQKPAHCARTQKRRLCKELDCSNSLKAERLDSASGLLKEEMRRMGSQLLNAAETARVAAGGALAVDRDAFSAEVTRMVESCENITVHREQVEHIDASAPILVATGPLTDGALADDRGLDRGRAASPTMLWPPSSPPKALITTRCLPPPAMTGARPTT